MLVLALERHIIWHLKNMINARLKAVAQVLPQVLVLLSIHKNLSARDFFNEAMIDALVTLPCFHTSS